MTLAEPRTGMFEQVAAFQRECCPDREKMDMYSSTTNTPNAPSRTASALGKDCRMMYKILDCGLSKAVTE